MSIANVAAITRELDFEADNCSTALCFLICPTYSEAYTYRDATGSYTTVQRVNSAHNNS